MKDRAAGYRGSLTWHRVGGTEYLVRSYYDGAGRRRRKNEGRRDERTETVKAGWEAGRARAKVSRGWRVHPPFEAIVLDERGGPLRIVVPDPRVFAAHKHWLSGRLDRDPTKRARDAAQARVVAALVRRYLRHLPYEAAELRMLPRDVVEAAVPLFAAPAEGTGAVA